MRGSGLKKLGIFLVVERFGDRGSRLGGMSVPAELCQRGQSQNAFFRAEIGTKLSLPLVETPPVVTKLGSIGSSSIGAGVGSLGAAWATAVAGQAGPPGTAAKAAATNAQPNMRVAEQ